MRRKKLANLCSDEECESYWSQRPQKEKNGLERDIKLSHILNNYLFVPLEPGREIKFLPRREVTEEGWLKSRLIQYFGKKMYYELTDPKLCKRRENFLKMNSHYQNRVPGLPDIIAQIQESAEEGRSGEFLISLNHLPFPCNLEVDRLERAYCIIDWVEREGYKCDDFKISRFSDKLVTLEGSIKKINF